MKPATRKAQIETIRNFQQKLRNYINTVPSKKVRVFTLQELKDITFHLQTISTLTDESDIARKAAKLEKLFWKVTIFEINGRKRVPENKGRIDAGRARSEKDK